MRSWEPFVIPRSFSLFYIQLLTSLLFVTDKGKPTSIEALGLVYIRKLQCNKLASEFIVQQLRCT